MILTEQQAVDNLNKTVAILLCRQLKNEEKLQLDIAIGQVQMSIMRDCQERSLRIIKGATQ